MLRHKDVVGVMAEVGEQLTDIEETFIWCFDTSPGERSPQPSNWQAPWASIFGVRVDKSSEGSQFPRMCLESAIHHSFHVSCNPGVSFPSWTQTWTLHSYCWDSSEIKHLNCKFRAGTKWTLTLRVYKENVCGGVYCVWLCVFCGYKQINPLQANKHLWTFFSVSDSVPKPLAYLYNWLVCSWKVNHFKTVF